jgi:hypothetical protein
MYRRYGLNLFSCATAIEADREVEAQSDVIALSKYQELIICIFACLFTSIAQRWQISTDFMGISVTSLSVPLEK